MKEGTRIAAALATAAVAALCSAPPRPAEAVECVNRRGDGGCYQLIQDAIDNASVGEEIVIRPGRYRQRFVVSKRVRIRGAGRRPTAVVIDGEGSGVIAAIEAPGTRISNLALLNGGQLVDVGGGADGVTLEGLVLRSADTWCVRSAATETTVLGTSASQCRGAGIELAAGGTVSRSTVSNTGAQCILAADGPTRVLGNGIRGCYGSGIEVNGSPALASVRNNRLEGIGNYAVAVVSSEDALVEGNSIDGAGGGVRIIATPSYRIVANRIANTRNSVVSTRLEGVLGQDATVSDNVALWSDYGFDVIFPGQTLLVSGNRAVGMQEDCIYVEGGAQTTIRDNSASSCGTNCIYVGPDTGPTVLRRNLADSCARDGFYLDDSDLLAVANTARNAFLGFNVQGSTVLLRENRALQSSFRFCDGGTGTVLEGNNFSTSTCP